MLRPRIIPCLLIQKNGLVKTLKFGQPKYVGDPINAVKIFNEKQADELIVLDIDASINGVEPDYKLISKLDLVTREEFEILKKLVQKQELAIKKLSKKNKIYDGKGLYMIPGLWDSHIHFAFEEELSLIHI